MGLQFYLGFDSVSLEQCGLHLVLSLRTLEKRPELIDRLMQK